MVIFQNEVIQNGNDEQILFVRRSGRLSNRQRPNRDNEHYETIDLTLDEDSQDEQDNVIDQARENVIEGENLDKGNVSDKEKGDVADVENNVAKGKMDEKRDELREKMEHESEGNRKGKCAAGKRKMKPHVVKGTKKVDTENGDFKDKDAAHEDGNSTDDDFVSPKKTKIHKVSVSKKKIFTTKRFEKKGKVGSGNKKGKNRVHLRNPPENLFRVITHLSEIQKNDVRRMGFGEVLEFKISKVPTRLAYWLLDMFDENTCVLDVKGKRINITPDVVNNMLGVPKGDVHIKTRDNSDYRNPLIRQWKEQFGEDVKKYFNSHVAKEILETKRGGWMFKLNFLVLFFSTIGELNLSNTVNLRFLPCINTEDDIPKLDWCTYIIECLVVYATLDSPIKHCSSELLYKLEGEMFRNQPFDDSAADDGGADEVIHDEDVDEDIGWEDDVFEDPGSESVPVNAEVMKKNLSLYLKRAGDLRDMADRLLVKGLEDNPDDNGFMELKELRDQMFVNRKYYHNPEHKEGLTKETYDKCFTPEKGVNKKDSGAADEYVFPFTQVAIAMSDEPPATQGKDVVDDLAEDQVLLDSLRDFVSQEPTDGGGFKTPDHPISVRAHLSNTSNRLSRFGRESMGNKSNDIVPVYPDPVPLNVVVPNLAHARAKRSKLLPEVYRSPYMTREVSVVDGLGKHEREVAECFFSARFSETDIVFKTRYVDGERVVLESLFPGIDIASGAIDLFTHVLNNAEKHRSKMTVKRLFCHTSMLTSDMESWEYERMFDKFVENMDTVVDRSEYKTLNGVQLVFFPVIQGRHFFVVCMNMKDGEVQILDNLLLPDKTDDERFTWFVIHLVVLSVWLCSLQFVKISVFEDYLLHKKNAYYERMTHATRKVLPLGCRTTNNFVDCGVFTMRHMETYKGDGADLCCLSKEGKKQLNELRDLRIKYAVKILLSDCNLVKTDIDKEVNAYRNVPAEEKKRLRMAASETIKSRVSTKFEPSLK
ncbi:ulp1 protease family, C-terminal catalytic domain-containing protein [Artemisia annua]|uniref:Ulp1 protease family, C-terminal catalytic domain-containing protein n=1 Tax=Artemisia annua TaxID=35608 RepID=A0A2U1NFQ1_ARTAN|nr:ulp1 protease family, C-terminal catalytic domain-containing protein [Artemisia annua]